MTNLTELELDEHYYLKLNNGKTEVQKFIGGFVLRNDDEIAEVLGKVPSYEEWQKHRKTLLKTQEKNCDLEIINTKLKELLKGAREVLKMVDTYCGDYDSINGFLIIEKINQVLGEE